MGENRLESISSPDNDSFSPLKVDYMGVLSKICQFNISRILSGLLKWVSLAALAASLVLGFLIVSNKNRCDRLLRFFRGDTALEYERQNNGN